MLQLNVWGIHSLDERDNEKGRRVRSLAEQLRASDYDLVLLQELLNNDDYRVLREVPWWFCRLLFWFKKFLTVITL